MGSTSKQKGRWKRKFECLQIYPTLIENRRSSASCFCFELTYPVWFVMSVARHLVSTNNAIYQKDMAISELDLSYGTLTKAFPWWQNGMYLLNSHLSLTYLIISRLVSIVHVPFLCTYIPPQHSTMEGHSVITYFIFITLIFTLHLKYLVRIQRIFVVFD